MKQDFLKEFVTQIFEHQEQKNAEEKRKNHFRDIGRKGGLARKNTPLFSKLISVRLTPKEYQKVNENAQRLNLKLSKYIRLLLTEKELKINEFKTDEVLLSYGTHFVRIKNLLRNREFSKLESKQEILKEIEIVTKLIYRYLYERGQK